MKRLLILMLLCPLAWAEVGTVTQPQVTYIGLAADTKPIMGVARGAEFIEIDTNKVYRWKGAPGGGSSTDWVEIQTTIALLSGEDPTNNVMKTEQQFSYCLDDADLVCKASAGFLHTVSCWGEDAAATAGRVQIRDSSTTTGGTVVWQHEFDAAIAKPVQWTANIIMTAGIAIDWDTTADVFCTVSYR